MYFSVKCLVHKNERLEDFLSAGLQKDETGNKYS